MNNPIKKYLGIIHVRNHLKGEVSVHPIATTATSKEEALGYLHSIDDPEIVGQNESVVLAGAWKLDSFLNKFNN